ncbi:MAG: toxin glutamine deamidase domain-containing protein [Muribaculaceae bacterium]|nr:toxin glutamine deamidase domain-containing protein [Muribaculaceae bacterium]
MKRPSHDACMALIEAIDAYVEKADTDLLAQLKNAGYALPKETLDEINELADRLTKQLGARGKAIYDRFVQIVDPIKWEAATELDRLHLFGLMSDEDQAERIERYAREFRDAYKELLPELIQSYSAEVDNKLAIQGISKRTQAWMRQWPTQTASFIEQGIRNDLLDILSSALQKGESIDKVQQRILDSGIRNPEWKARRMALTEMLRAHSYAQLEAYRMNPAVHQKRWVHTGAKFSEPRANHLQYSGTIVGMDEKFTLPGSGATCDCPRDASLPPGESINCHCLMQPVVDSDKLGLPLAERERLYREAVANDDREWEEELDREKHIQADKDRGEYVKPSITLNASRLDGNGAKSLVYPMMEKKLTLEQTVKGTNPNYKKEGRKYTENCQRCVSALEARMREMDVVAKPCIPGANRNEDPLPYDHDAKGWPKVYKDGELLSMRSNSGKNVRRKIEKQMAKWGDKSRAIVSVTWRDTYSGHVFIAIQKEGKTLFVDPQTGNMNVAHYLDLAKVSNPQLMRIDNLEFTELIDECVKPRVEL